MFTKCWEQGKAIDDTWVTDLFHEVQAPWCHQEHPLGHSDFCVTVLFLTAVFQSQACVCAQGVMDSRKVMLLSACDARSCCPVLAGLSVTGMCHKCGEVALPQEMYIDVLFIPYSPAGAARQV